MQSQTELAHYLKDVKDVLRSEELELAFLNIDRADFVDDEYKVEAYEDYPIPIGYGSTISQPTTVAFMLEKLAVEKGNRVLDVGSGSGWTTALLASLVGEQGHVYGVELVPTLAEKGKQNLATYPFQNADIEQVGLRLGLQSHAPYDRILVSAAADEIPDELVMQLKEGGIMVLPVGDALVVAKKKTGGMLQRTTFPGFSFVPLVR